MTRRPAKITESTLGLMGWAKFGSLVSTSSIRRKGRADDNVFEIEFLYPASRSLPSRSANGGRTTPDSFT